MKSGFSLFIVLFFFGCSVHDEEKEFIRLENLSAEICHRIDREDFYNPDTSRADNRLAGRTDSLFAIAEYYQVHILQTQTPPVWALETLRQKMSARKQGIDKDRWKRFAMDSLLCINPQLAADFRKASFRIKLGSVLSKSQGSYCYQTGQFDSVTLHYFIISGQRGDTIDGEFALGYTLSDSVSVDLKLERDGRPVAPETITWTNQKTDAVYRPSQAGKYLLSAHIRLYDPITGIYLTISQKRQMYVKP